MRRSVVIGSIVVVAAAAVAAIVAKRTVRWNDARMMPPPLEAAVRAFGRGDDTAGQANVHRLLKRYRAPAWEPQARVLAAFHLEGAGRAGEILEVLPRDLPPDHPLAADAFLLRARGLIARGRFDAAAEAAGRASAVAGFPHRDDAREVRAGALDAKGSWREAVRSLVPDATPPLAIAAARIAAAHGDREQARQLLVAAALASSADDIPRVEEGFATLLSGSGVRFDAPEHTRLVARARALLDEGAADAALRLLSVGATPTSSERPTPEESLVHAEAALKLGRLAEARGFIARARLGSPAERVGAAYFEARLAGADGRGAAWRTGMESVARSGASPWRERALLDLARAAEGAPSRRALESYRRYRLAAGANADPLALLREAWVAYDLGLGADADAGFARALAPRDTPDGVRVTALYWQARRAESKGRTASARETYRAIVDAFPNHYYGILAVRRLAMPAALPPEKPPPPVDPAGIGGGGRWLAAARIWSGLGVWDQASPCYGAAMDAAPTPARTAIACEAATRAVESRALSEAIGFAQRAVSDRDRTPASAAPRELWRFLVPAPPTPAITVEARAQRLDPHLVAAVGLQESAWNPLAVSAVGARGLLQVMPAIGEELAHRLGLRAFVADDLFDPAVNAKLGCAHLADYVRRFGGSTPHALAAYNAGPSRVERWSLAAGRDDDERFVERVPIPETRLYVKRITANARLYAMAWPEGFPAPAR